MKKVKVESEKVGLKLNSQKTKIMASGPITSWDISDIILYLFFSNFIYSEKATAPHSSTLAWKIPWMEEPGRLQSMGSLRVRLD